MTDFSPRILVTGFEPFAGADDNPSARVVEHLAGRAHGTLRAATLPVSTRRMPAVLHGLLDEHRPDVVVGLGEARGSDHVRIETVAVNRLDFRTPDNDGISLADQLISPQGSAALDVTLPTGRLLDGVRAAGLACALSDSAGCYLCNQMMYLTLDWASRQPHRPLVGFIHLPSLPTQNTSAGGACPTLSLEDSLRAVRAALDVLGHRAG